MKLTPQEIRILSDTYWARTDTDKVSLGEFAREVESTLLAKLQNMKPEGLREEIGKLLTKDCTNEEGNCPQLVNTKCADCISDQLLSLITPILAVQIEAAEARGHERGESEVAGTTIVLPHRLLHEDKLIGGTA